MKQSLGPDTATARMPPPRVQIAERSSCGGGVMNLAIDGNSLLAATVGSCTKSKPNVTRSS